MAKAVTEIEHGWDEETLRPSKINGCSVVCKSSFYLRNYMNAFSNHKNSMQTSRVIKALPNARKNF